MPQYLRDEMAGSRQQVHEIGIRAQRGRDRGLKMLLLLSLQRRIQRNRQIDVALRALAAPCPGSKQHQHAQGIRASEFLHKCA